MDVEREGVGGLKLDVKIEEEESKRRLGSPRHFAALSASEEQVKV